MFIPVDQIVWVKMHNLIILFNKNTNVGQKKKSKNIIEKMAKVRDFSINSWDFSFYLS